MLEIYDDAVRHVYGYLLARCGAPAVAEDLTAETFLAAVDAARRDGAPEISVGWLVGVARHKLVDHWRREAREARKLRAAAADLWDAELDVLRAHATLRLLTPDHRAVLTLRYLDDLPVARVAAALGRTPQATEALLTRAKAAFRRAYDDGEGDGRA
jgi:RNA polymerase sigma-70 factor (ECF subfamily)